MERDQQFVEQTVRAMVEHPDQVKTSRKVDERGVLITLSVANTDMRFVLGKNGSAISALRLLLKVVGSRDTNRVNLKLEESEEDYNHRKSFHHPSNIEI